jgi:hypothetical protein
MPTEQFANKAITSLLGGIGSGDSSLVVNSAAAFPGTGQFRILIDSEILLVTGVSGTTFTVSRGQEGTSAAAHLNAAVVTLILTAGALVQLKADAFTPGGDLTGSATSQTIGALAVTDGKVAAANKDGAVGTACMRTLGTGSAQACAGDDSRLSNARVPTAHATSHNSGGGDDLAIVGWVLRGSGDPEGVVTAPVATLFLRTDGGTSTTLYVKETGTGNTGWVPK